MSVHVRDPEAVARKLGVLEGLEGSAVQIITDFDMTLTKQTVGGQPGYSSHKVLERFSAFGPAHCATVQALHQKYYPIEIDLSIPLEEKIPLMVQVGKLNTFNSCFF